MKQKLKIAFILIALALVGIIVFQIYWSVNAYKLNKEKFDANINIAMKKAMDDCKRDYYDSIRNVLVRRLSPPQTAIKIDTIREKNDANREKLNGNKLKILDAGPPKDLHIWISTQYSHLKEPFVTTSAVFDNYRSKIRHKASIPEVITEMALEDPALMNHITILLSMYDIENKSVLALDFTKKHPNAPIDSILKFNRSVQHSIYDLPIGQNANNSKKVWTYLKMELKAMNIYSPFGIISSKQNIPHFKPNMHYSETLIYEYKYLGFTYFGVQGPVYYVRAVFHKPQYLILRRMIFSLSLSVILLFFTFYCFYFIARTIIDQKKLADLKDDFINNMTHELKTPIAIIAVAIEALQSFNALNDPEKTHRYLQTAKEELSRLNNLVTKVLDIAAFENKEIELNKEEIDINELVKDIIASEKTKTTKTVEFTYENKTNVKSIFVDKIHFRNVLANLVDNAIKYSSALVTINIECFISNEEFSISVKDNGNGIPPSHLGFIFDKFHRVPTGNLHAIKGTGLGLSYVKYIVEAHGGNILVKSELNKGSEFIVSLPLTNE